MTAPLRLAALSAAASLAAGTASADLTAAEVWADWQESAASSARPSPSVARRSGGTLTLRDVSITMDGPDGGVNGTIAEVVMTEQGDGSVAIEMSPEFPLDFTVTGPRNETASFSLLIDQSALDLTASGDARRDLLRLFGAADDRHADRGDRGRRADGPRPERRDFGLDGAYTVTGGRRTRDDRQRAQGRGSLRVVAEGTDPEGSGDTFDIALTMADLVTPKHGDDVAAHGHGQPQRDDRRRARHRSGTTTHGPATVAPSPARRKAAPSRSTAPTVRRLRRRHRSRPGSTTAIRADFALSVSGDQIPFPEVAIAAEEVGSRLAMPVGVSEEPQDVGLALRFVGLTISDQIWSMFDPAGVLPRDPATLVVDIAGKANWLVDVFDPASPRSPWTHPGRGPRAHRERTPLAARRRGTHRLGRLHSEQRRPVPMPAGTLNLRSWAATR
jgi:hypothetical protein